MSNSIVVHDGQYIMYIIDAQSVWKWDNRTRQKTEVKNIPDILNYIKMKVPSEKYKEIEQLMFESI